MASSEALDLLRAMRMVLYRQMAMANRMTSKVGMFYHPCLFVCPPGGHRDNTEHVVTQWQRRVASGVALDMPHWAMLPVLQHCSTMTMEMACNTGMFAHCRRLCP